VSARLAALPGGRPDRPAGWEALLREAVRPEFQVEVYRPKPGDRVLFGPTCIVGGCRSRGMQRADGMHGHLCEAHARAWRRDGQPPQAEWVARGARGLRHERLMARCLAAACPRSASTQGLCGPHYKHWRRCGQPPIDALAESAPLVRIGSGVCLVPDCRFPAVVGGRLCDGHHKSYRWLRRYRGDVDVESYVAHLVTAREQSAPGFDLRGVGPIVGLELGYALQCRHDQQGAVERR
jgi:hypothetical protein